MTKDELLAKYSGGKTSFSKDDLLAKYGPQQPAEDRQEVSSFQPFSLASSVSGSGAALPTTPKAQQAAGSLYNAFAVLPSIPVREAAKEVLGPEPTTTFQKGVGALKAISPIANVQKIIGLWQIGREIDSVAKQARDFRATPTAQQILQEASNKALSRVDFTVSVPEAKSRGEKLARFGGGAAAALVQFAAFKKAGLSSIAAFEAQNQVNGGVPGEGALMYLLMSGAGKAAGALKPATKIGTLGKELATVGAETGAIAAIPAAKQLATGEKQDWSFLLLPAILRTPSTIRAGWAVGASSVPRLRDFIPVEPSLGPTIESARAQKLLPPGQQKLLPPGQQVAQAQEAQTKALPMSFAEQVDRAAAKLYDDLVEKAPGDKAAAKDLERLGNGYYLPKLEALQEKAIAGDQAAVDAIRAGEYYGGENAGAAGFRKAVIDRKLVTPPKPGKVVSKHPEAEYRKATEVAAVPEATPAAPEGRAAFTQRTTGVPAIPEYRANIPEARTEAVTPQGAVAAPKPASGPVELPEGLPEAITKLTAWIPKAEVFSKGAAARKVRALRAKQASESQAIYRAATQEQGMRPAEAAEIARGGLKQQAAVPDYKPPEIAAEGWLQLKDQAARVFADKPFERANAAEALGKIQTGHWLAKHEYKYLEPIIGQEAVQGLWDMAQKNGGFSVIDTISRISGLSKCFVGTDMQLGYQFADAWASHPVIVTRGIVRGLKSEASRKELNKIRDRVRNDPLFDEAAGYVNFRSAKPWGELGAKGRTEQYAGGGGEYLAGLWKGKGGVLEPLGSGARAYGRLLRWREERFTPIANSILLDLWKASRKNWIGIQDEAKREMVKKATGTHINTLTRLLEIGGKNGPGIQQALNMVLFSTSSTISRPMEILNILTNKGGRLEAGKALAANIAKIHLAGALVNLFGQAYSLTTGKEPPFSMGVNPIGSDYGKLRVGDSYFDPTFGLAGYLRGIARLAMAAEVKAERIAFGRIRTTAGGQTIPTAWETITGFFSNKEAPWIGLARSLATGKDYAGKDIGPAKAFGNVLIPTQAQAFLEALADDGVAMAMTAAVAEQMSIPVLTYPDSPGKLRAQARDRIATETYQKPWDQLSETEQKTLAYKNYQLFKDLDEMVKEENKRNPRDYTKAKLEEVDAGEIAKSRLPKGARDLLGDYPIPISRTYGTLRLNDERYNKLIEYVSKELGVRIRSEDFKAYSPEYKKQVLDLMVKEATRWAWLKMRAELKLY